MTMAQAEAGALPLPSPAPSIAQAFGQGGCALVTVSRRMAMLTERSDSPWYPTMRLFRQTASGDWDGPLAQLREELSAVALR